MRYISCVLCLICVFAVNAITAQERDPNKIEQVVALPRELALSVIAVQPDCPLQFEEVILFGYVNHGGGGSSSRLLNRSTRPIYSFTIAKCTPGSGCSWIKRVLNRASGPLMPGQTWPQAEDKDEVELVPLTDALRDRLKLSGPMKGTVIFMVVHVEFTDGTTYDDQATFKALQAYSDK